MLAPGALGATVDFDLFGSVAQGWGLTQGSMTIPGPNVTVDEGDEVTIHLHSADSLPHKFYVDYDGDGSPDGGEPQSGFFTDAETITFTADTPGDFTYFCSVHPATMFGSWTTVAGQEPVHDVAVTGVTPSPTDVEQGASVTVAVDVANQGEAAETTTVTAFAGGLTVGSETITIPAGATQTATFTWDTTGVAPGDYEVRGEASAVSGETDMSDNTFTDGDVTVRPSSEPPAGAMRAELTRRSAWPGRHHLDLSDGSTQTLNALVQSTGTGSVLTKVVFTIMNRDTGTVVAVVSTTAMTLGEGGIGSVSATWTAVAGRFDVVAQCVFDSNGNGTFDGASADVKAFGFAVVP
ncbi:MAG TPA: CARDB domain-containing protein [Thermoplasmata archaeon]|nr:CARDB domain-containing protein [Thermoplasmata archaeon]